MNRIRLAAFTFAVTIPLHVSAGLVWAQKDGKVPEHEEGWLKWAVAAGLAVVICITGFINAKRSHLD